MIRIEGVIRLTSPLFIAAPGESRYDFKHERFVGNDDKGTPCTRVRKERIVHVGTVEGADESKSYTSVPVIPANSLRGLLRRCVSDLVFESIAAKGGKKLSLDAYHTLTCGAAIGTPDEVAPSVPEVKAVLEHPFLGLFGGTTKMIRGALKVFNGYPICPATKDAGIVGDDFEKYAANTNWLTQVDMFKRDSDVEKNIPQSALNGLDSPEETINAWREFLAGSTPRPDGIVPTNPSTWAARELVMPGVSFQVGFEIMTYDHAMVGLTLLGLEKLIARNSLGGRTAIGYGRFRALDFSLTDTKNNSSVIVFDSEGKKLDMTNREIKGFVDAAKEFLSELDRDELEALCAPKPKRKNKAEEGE